MHRVKDDSHKRATEGRFVCVHGGYVCMCVCWLVLSTRHKQRYPGRENLLSIPLSEWPMGMSGGYFLDCWVM